MKRKQSSAVTKKRSGRLKLALRTLHAHGSVLKADFLPMFFRTGEGEYAEGDVFIGATVPQIRQVAIEFADLVEPDLSALLHSKIHEERLLALLIMAKAYEQLLNAKDLTGCRRAVGFYLRHLDRVNNWDLVDSSAASILGQHLLQVEPKRLKILRVLARSKDLWRRRVAMVATLAFIRAEKTAITYEIAELLINDKHDLIHKAVGWMMREAGKRNVKELEEFLQIHASTMPRTMLRYSIEKFNPKRRAFYRAMKTSIRRT